MPPTTSTPVVPETLDKAAHDYLQHFSIVPRRPTIRSSDYELTLSDPFRYYLTRRLGLVSRLSWSRIIRPGALDYGSWFHERARLMPIGDDAGHPTPKRRLQELLEARLVELKEICESSGITGQSLEKTLQNERKACWEACAWCEASFDTTAIYPDTFQDFQTLARELRIVVPTPSHLKPTRKCVAQLDVLLYNEKSNRLWIVDWKTTSLPVNIRLRTCPFEFQTQHYIWITREALPFLISKYKLPEDVKVGGMIHVGIGKPNLVFGTKDRDRIEETRIMKGGPDKGKPRTEYKYVGDPKLSNYVARIKHWYAGTGEYEHLAPERGANPLFNMSISPAKDVLDRIGNRMYHDRLRHVHSHATRYPYPSEFLSSTHHLIIQGQTSVWFEFYTNPVDKWPAIIQHHNLMQQIRDEDIVESQTFNPVEEMP